MNNFQFFYSLLALCLTLSACQKETVPEDYLQETPGVYSVEGEVRETTLAVTEEQDFFLQRLDSITWTLDKRSDLAADIAVGSVLGGGLTQKFPDPYLVKVIEIVDEDKNLVLTTRHAGLMEAFSDVNIEVRETQQQVQTRATKLKVSSGPFSIGVSGGASVDIDPDINIEYDEFYFNLQSEGLKVTELEFGLKGFRTVSTYKNSISGTASGSATVTLDPNLKLPITLVIGAIPVIISNRIVIKGSANLSGSGSLCQTLTSTMDKLDIELYYDGKDFNFDTNVTEISWINDLEYDITEASGSLNIDLGLSVEYQLSLYELYSVGNLYFNIQPFGLGIEAIKNPTLPQIDVDADIVGRVKAGIRGSTGLSYLLQDETGYEFFNTVDFSTTLIDERIDIRDFSVPITCALDVRESFVTAECNPTTGKIDVTVRWDAHSSVNGQYLVSVGGLVSNFYDFNIDNSFSVNPEFYDFTNSIILEHEDYQGCQHVYNISNPCFVDFVCPDGNCWKKMNDGKTWMTKNFNDTNLGINHHEDPSGEILGRYLTYEEMLNGDSHNSGQVQGICPEGWHIPSLKEWQDLRNAYNGISALLTPGIEGITEWPSSIASGFSALPSGAYQHWIDGGGGQFEKTIFEEGEQDIRYWNIDPNGPPSCVVFNLKTLIMIRENVTPELALPCRCVQD